MITSNLYSMSVKELCARLSVLLVVCAFALVAKAELTIVPIPGEDMAFTLTITDPGKDLGPAANWTADKVFYTDENGNKVTAGQVKKLIVTTDAGDKKLGNGEFKTFKEGFTSLSYLDLENSAVDNAAFGGNDKYLNAMGQLRTLVFPKADGLVIPASAFENNQYLETVIFPDRPDSESGGTGTYEIMAYAFRNSAVKTVSLGKGYSIPDMQADWNQAWSSPSGSGASIFEHCKELVNVVLDNSITSLGEKAFSATYSLEYLILPENLEHFGSLCCKESGIRTITIPDKVYLGPDAQAFQGCVRLNNVYVNADNVQVRTQGIMEKNQTFNFRYTAGDEPTYSAADYEATNTYTASDYSDCPFVGKRYSIPILHYPGTNTAIQNYRVPYYLHYHGVDTETGTTWPNAYDMDNKENGAEGYVGYAAFYNDDPNMEEYSDVYAGWRQFLIGNNTFKEQKVFYDERIKESRWYSICLPVNMTEAQFVNAYGVGAALNEFSGAVYDEENNMIVLKFDKPAEVKNGYLLQKNVPYMIHPAKIKFTKRKEVVLADPTNPNSGVEFEKVEGQEDYVTKEVIATFDVESDLFVKWDIVLNGGQAFGEAIDAIQEATTNALIDKAVPQTFSHESFSSVDFTFKGSYLGAEIYGPKDASGKYKVMGTSPTLPVGAYYLGYKEGMEKPQFFKAKGTATWTPYCALVESGTVTTGDGNEAKVLGVDFINSDVVVTKIGTPTIQIPMVKTDNKVYNLNGQVVRENSKDINGLKGIYVVGGKKVVFN